MKKPITLTILFILLIAVLAWLGTQHYNRVLGAEVCPPCDCEITAQKIISNSSMDYSNLNVSKIVLPNKKDLIIQIGDEVFTKGELLKIR